MAYRRDFPSNVRRFRALGGMEKMLDLVLWTTSTFLMPESEAMVEKIDSPTPERSPQYPRNADGEERPVPKPNKILMSAEAKIKSPEVWAHHNPILKLLFDIFYRVTESEFQAWSKKGEVATGDNGGAGNPGTRRVAPLELYTLVPFLLDLFNENIRQTPNNKRVRLHVKYVFPSFFFS